MENGKISGVKGGRARLVVIDHEVKEFLYGVPEVRKRLSLSLEEEPRADYTPQVHSQPFRQILDAVEKMSPVEQENLLCSLLVKGFAIFSPGLILTNQRKKTAGVFLLPFIFMR